MVVNTEADDGQAVDVLAIAFAVDEVEWPNVSQKVHLRQSAMLLSLAAGGQLIQACVDSGVPIGVMNQWRDLDVGGFRERLNLARQVFAESLERLAFDRVRQQQPGANPLLLIRLLEAHLPDRYKLASDSNPDAALEFLAKVKAVAAVGGLTGTRPALLIGDDRVKKADRVTEDGSKSKLDRIFQ